MIVIILVILLWTTAAQAADYYIDLGATGCSPTVDTDYDPVSRTCGTGSETVYDHTTVSSMAATAGDTVYIRAGTYSNPIEMGTKTGTASATLAIEGYPGEFPIIRPTTSTVFPVTNNSGMAYVRFKNIDFDGINLAEDRGLKFNNSEHHLTFIGNTIRNMQMNFLVNGDGNVYRKNIIKNFRSDCVAGNRYYGWYHNNGNDNIFESNEVFDMPGGGIQVYPGPATGTIVRYNYIHDNNFCSNSGIGGILIATPSTQVYGNVIVNNGSNPSSGASHGIQMFGGVDDVTIDGNTIYGNKGTGLYVMQSTSTGIVARNNIILGNGTNIDDNGTGTTLTTNRTTGTASDLFTDHLNDDFSLKAGSAAINAGTNIGQAFCGSAPDQGAFQTPQVTAASINGNTLDVTVCSVYPPIQPLGTWTPACTGTGCGTPVTSGTPSITGGGLVRIAVSGITGGACASGQTWTISASGNNTDSVLIGNQFNQPLHTTSNFAVDSSACTGSGGGGFPSGAVAIYNFENNLNDSSGNANHAVGSANISYAASKNGQGVQFTNGVNSYVDTGLLSGHNPSTTHLVVAFGVRISQADLGGLRYLGGTALGTNQRFYVRRGATNTWELGVQSTVPAASEFPAVAGDTHVCVKFNPTTDTATLYINGNAGTTTGASLHTYTSYTLASAFRAGLPDINIGATRAPPDIADQLYIYTTDVSCADIYAAWQPPIQNPVVVQAGHQWQGVYLAGGIAENRGAASEQRTIVKGGAAALVVQLECTGGDCGFVSPRFHYNVNGGEFNNVIPATPTADGVSMWGADSHAHLNIGPADGPIGSTPGTHSDGIWILSSSTIPTFNMGNNTSYTIGATFKVDMPMPDPNNPPRVCIKVFDQSGNPLPSYTPSEGACLTQKNATASGGP